MRKFLGEKTMMTVSNAIGTFSLKVTIQGDSEYNNPRKPL